MRKRSLFILVLIAILLPVAVYLRVWDYYAVNIAKWDDHVLKKTLLDAINAHGWTDYISILSVQHNEHRIFLTRLVALLDFSYFGQLNYKHLMFVGNLMLLLVIVLWWRLLKHNGKTLYALLPVALLWPSLAHWENMYWGMASIQNFGVVTLVLVTLYWCLKNAWGYVVLGLLAGALAAFSSGNGLIALPLAAFLLFLTRNYKRGIGVAITAALVIAMYFIPYVKPDYNPEVDASAWQIIKGFMAFLGSFAEVSPIKGRQDISVAFGFILFLVSISIITTSVFRLIRNQYTADIDRLTDAFCLGTLLFVLATAIIVVWSRAGFGVEVLLTSRYKIYSFLILITAYLFIVIPIRGSFYNPYVSGIAVLCLIFNIFSYHYFLVDAYNLRKFMITSYFNQVYDNKDLNPFTSDTTVVSGLVAKPSLFYERWLPLVHQLSSEKAAGNLPSVETLRAETQVATTENEVIVRNSTYRSQRLQDSGVYLLLSGDERYYLLPTYRNRNQSRKQLFFHQQYFSPGFHSEHSYDVLEIKPGKYAYGLVLQKGDSTGLIMYPDTLIVPEYTRSPRIETNW